jgi:hypothetical protein
MRAPEVGVRHFPDQIWLSVDAARTISERSAIFFVQAVNVAPRREIVEWLTL